ncbi:MAG: carbonic anhydrase [Candidatus Micrarchaeota archaeon]|nr:carbonic anhydrase [Candidatus Micrarchaeota archaeon]
MIGDSNNPNNPHSREELLEKLKAGQNPPLIAIYCSDSRVDINLLGANPGEVFAIENAGNVFGLGDESKASLAYALSHFSTDGRLAILVLGHTKCGAVTTACRLFREGQKLDGTHPSIASLMRHVFPAVERAAKLNGDIIDNAISENVKAQMQNVRDFTVSLGSTAARNIDIYGAVYEISANDDVLPIAWHISALSNGRPSTSAKITEIVLGNANGKRIQDLIRKMGLEKHISMQQLPSSGLKGRKC